MFLRHYPKRGGDQGGSQKHQCSGHASLRSSVLSNVSRWIVTSYPVIAVPGKVDQGKQTRSSAGCLRGLQLRRLRPVCPSLACAQSRLAARKGGPLTHPTHEGRGSTSGEFPLAGRDALIRPDSDLREL